MTTATSTSTKMLAICGTDEDEDGIYLTIGNERVKHVEFGEHGSNGHISVLPVYALSEHDGVTTVKLRGTFDPAAKTPFYTVRTEDVMSEDDFKATFDSCGC